MNELGIASIVFTCVFGSAMLGLFLGNALPEHHLSQDSKDVVKLGTAGEGACRLMLQVVDEPLQRGGATIAIRCGGCQPACAATRRGARRRADDRRPTQCALTGQAIDVNGGALLPLTLP